MNQNRDDKNRTVPEFHAAAFNEAESLVMGRAQAGRDWAEGVGAVSPKEFTRLWTQGLTGDPRLHMSFTGAGQGEWGLYSSGMSAEGNFDRQRGTFHLEEIRIREEGSRRRGAGKRFFNNMIAACRAWGVKTIDLRGGREDGAYFWSRRGSHIEPFFVDRFKDDVRDVLAKMKDVPPETAARVNEILDTSGPEVNARLARLEDQAGHAPIGLQLLRQVNPTRMIFDLEDPEQAKWIEAGLKGAHNGGTSPPAPIMV